MVAEYMRSETMISMNTHKLYLMGTKVSTIILLILMLTTLLSSPPTHICVLCSQQTQGEPKLIWAQSEHEGVVRSEYVTRPLVIVVVDNLTYENYRFYIDRYVQESRELLRSGNYSIEIKVIDKSWNAQQLRDYLKRLYQDKTQKLEGAIFIGDVPYVLYNSSDYWGRQINGTVLNEYYTCLESEFIDLDGDGKIDHYELPLKYNIWLSVIKPPSKEADLALYFEKVHKYRYGLIKLPKRAYLDYSVDSSWGGPRNYEEDLIKTYNNTDFLGVFPTVVLVPWTDKPYSVLINNGTVTKIPWNSSSGREEFKNALASGYEMIAFWAHGTWYMNILYSDEWKTAKPGAFLYLITSCLNGEWHVQNYIAGWHIFGEGYGIVAVQSETSAPPLLFAQAWNNSFIAEKSLDISWPRAPKVFGDPFYPHRFYLTLIKTKYPNSLITIDSQSIMTDERGEVEIYLSTYGSHIIETPDRVRWRIRFQMDEGQYKLVITPLPPVVSTSEKTRLVFDGLYENDVLISKETLLEQIVEEPITLISLKDAKWHMEHLVTATTSVGQILGTGWYKEGDIATISINQTRVEKDSSTIYVFEGWMENNTLVSNSSSYSFIVKRPVHLVAKWKVETIPQTIYTTYLVMTILLLTISLAVIIPLLIKLRRRR